jgi:hypothetical protein
MTKTILLAAALSTFTTIAAADPPPPPKCMLVKAAGNDVGVEVHIHPTKMFGETYCRQDSRKAAEAWVAEHHACAAGKPAFDYTVTWGVAGQEKTIELHGYCPK